MIRLKSRQDIEKLVEGGKILAEVLEALVDEVKVGRTSRELDAIARRLIWEQGCVPSFLNYAPGGYAPFPAALCVSVNDVVVHGLPSDEVFREGDLVGLDLGLIYQNKYFLDSARSVGVGHINKTTQQLLKVTERALDRGIESAQIGHRIGDISHAVQEYAERNGFEVVRQLVGHGVGFAVHEPPQVPNFGKVGTGEMLKEGLVIAIEPMISIGDPDIETGEDGWSVRVKTGNLTAHFEHTIAITSEGPRVLT
ncbi:MAG: type I methionyl aminopeptidase [Candidatus Andersenbacteria bacterium RIFCSPHIGHO2_12_FULL_46_9]|nr:MAG: Methionine aminopeptidase [Parcubacteria group bacterium GW2011_GWA2_45_14]OGY35640.1 MAG: type I methionyl aminopeptidase [Candidatus Andersenbacteria bacterium RIFCSPHIGHO2_02_FULL_46_16]OGY36843.1 MAG: type I methionyl aminopeptidase [Candidatus Andersenbacteria bacterium RIFCSPLOWO2_02_FULL_46_11]OGY38462.1 MAG: type I methionyl aminopeptidase [Candidatus Andersenbacteria bacterium RIFCSPHIGHO2_12_FULL_46_9]OGY41642.1 MAG: type I methionyl aminopeptidase [Candidatus Andersenbacteria